MVFQTKKEKGSIVDHHLTLEDTLIERGPDGTLGLSQRGRRVHLSAQEVDMLVGWLALASPARLDTAHHPFITTLNDESAHTPLYAILIRRIDSVSTCA